MENKVYDDLNFSSNKDVRKKLESDEQILLSCHIIKVNRKLKRQDRNFMVTNKNVYNLEKCKIKRKIPIINIEMITVSTKSDEFVLHVKSDYDYRYCSFDRKGVIFEQITKAYTNGDSNKFMRFFFAEQPDLEMYTTTKQDLKQKKSRMPTEKFVNMTLQSLMKRLSGDRQQQMEEYKNTTQLYSRSKTEKVTVNDFNCLKVLGRGAFGKVMLVEKKDTKEVFAMKSIKKEDIIEKDQLEHTKTERIILEHCNHPFLVNLIYAFTTPDKIFFVTQFMKGGELFQHLRHSKRFEEKRAKFYAAEIALALDHLHSQNIIYRDLKPENILMDENGHICLTDFGMAKILKKGEQAQSFCGTPEYLSPEIITGVGHSKAADWWALGIFTFEMMFALPPFYNNNQEFMFQSIKEKDIVFPNHTQVTPAAKDFILQCTIKDPKKRLGSKAGINEIKAHPWFSDINFDLLLKKELTPPFRPQVDGQKWVIYFDEEFTNEPPINSQADKNPQLNGQDEQFQGFTYDQSQINHTAQSTNQN